VVRRQVGIEPPGNVKPRRLAENRIMTGLGLMRCDIQGRPPGEVEVTRAAAFPLAFELGERDSGTLGAKQAALGVCTVRKSN